MAWGTMSKCEGGDLERPLRLWSLLIDSVRCGGFQKPNNRETNKKKQRPPQPGSDKLSELLKEPQNTDDENEEVRRKEALLEGMKKVAKKLQAEDEDEGATAAVLEGAAEVRRLTKDDPAARTTLALLGVIPPLVALLDARDPTFLSQIAALYALLNLAIANDPNKAAIVIAGGVHKMLILIQSGKKNRPVAEAVVANFLGLSALDSNKPIIGSSGAIPFLVDTLRDVDGGAQAKQDTLRALYNLSISPSNVPIMLETELIPHLFSELGDTDTSERILSILGNVVSVPEGRRRISNGGVPNAFPILVDVLSWTDSPGCQEKAAYILMVMAHKSYADRHAMVDAGIVSSLLELTLVGSVLAQKRASRMLECLRVEKGKQALTATVSAPLSSLLLDPTRNDLSSMCGDDDDDDDDDEMTMSREKKAVEELVQQSLHDNMRRMIRRANLPHDLVPPVHFQSFTSTSTSKSLPF